MVLLQPNPLETFIDAIKKQSDKEKCQWLILIDEVNVTYYGNNFSSLCLDDNIEIVSAINPTTDSSAFNVIPPKDKKFIVKRLTFKHRNSMEISIFLLHFKEKMNVPGALYLSPNSSIYSTFAIPDSDDVALVESIYPNLDQVKYCAGCTNYIIEFIT